MRKLTILAFLCTALLIGCGETGNQQEQNSQATESIQTTEEALVETEELSAENTDETDTPENIEEATKEPEVTEPYITPLEQLKAELEDKLLFTGEVNKGYDSDRVDWFNQAKDEDSIVLIYRCDDVTHGGWGVLGWGANTDSRYIRGGDVIAASTEVDAERVIAYTIGEMKSSLQLKEDEDLTKLTLGAWNGGHITGLYYLPKEEENPLLAYLKSFELVHTYDGNLSNPDAIEEAVTVYEYLKSIDGQYCLTGQQESTWKGSPDYEINYIYENSGKYPAIRGVDFMHNDFQGCVNRAKEWWEKGGIPTICWHTGKDFNTAYNESKDDVLDFDKALTEGTPEYEKLVAAMDRAVPYLQQLEDAGVPVLWRPFHEFDGAWFWWGKGGPENFKKLWILMYERYTNVHHLDNLIWVLGYSGNGIEVNKWYPGDEYVDIIGADSYNDGANERLYQAIDDIAADKMPICFHECGQIPTKQELLDGEAKWLWFMTWHDHIVTENTVEAISDIYNSDYFITLDELPNFR